MFETPQNQLKKIKKLNKEYAWGFTSAHFKAVENVPKQVESDLQTVVLVPYFDTLGKTVDSLWQAIEDQAPKSFRSSGIKAANIRLHKGTFPKKQLKWVVLDVGTHRNISPKKIRETNDNVAGVEVLACALLHPDWTKAMDGNKVPYADIPGIEVNLPEFAPWSSSPYVFGDSGGFVDFDTSFADYGSPGYVEPVVVPGSLGTGKLGARPLYLGTPLEKVSEELKVMLDKEYKRGWNEAREIIIKSTEEL